VIVRVSQIRFLAHACSLHAALAEMLAPYDEATKNPAFLTFDAEDDEKIRSEYATGSREMVRMPDGELCHPLSERFRIPGHIGTSFSGGTCTSHKPPADATSVQIPNQQLYPTLEAYAEQVHGESLDPKTGTFGHWRNENAKWDWWSVGGRYAGWFPVTPGYKPLVLNDAPPAPNAAEIFERRLGKVLAQADPSQEDRKAAKIHVKDGLPTCDVVRVRDLDLDAVARASEADARAYLKEYAALRGGKRWGAFEGPEDMAHRIGLARVVEGPHTPEEGEVADRWGDVHAHLSSDDKRRDWTTVYRAVPDEEAFVRDVAGCFSRIASYAFLNESGWHEPGRVGWFGTASDEPVTYVPFKQTFADTFLRPGDPTDFLVAVDCHI